MDLIKEKTTKLDLDDVLADLKFGKYQIKLAILVGLMSIYSNIFLNYILMTADLSYRCSIPECETNTSSQQFMPFWIHRAIPFENDEPSKCKRYIPLTNSSLQYDGCTASFNVHEEEKCDNWVFETDEVNIVNEFGILCEDEKWQLSMVGTVQNIAQFIGIPLFGALSDQFGRKLILLLCTVMAAFFKICQALSPSYLIFLCFEFSSSIFAGSMYSSAFILVHELVHPEMRSLASMSIDFFYPVGAIVAGFIAWRFNNWRTFSLISYSPGLLFISYFWFIPESVRWLESKDELDEVKQILHEIATTNKCTDYSKKIEALVKRESCKKEKHSFVKSITIALKTKYILIRVLICSYLWCATTLIYYGLDINSVELAGNKYLNFILTSAVELPASILSGITLRKINRRESQSISFVLSGLSCLACEFIPDDMFWLSLAFFLISKFLITCSFCIIYIYTTEMFPTELRQSLCGLVSMLGRFGSLIAPQTMLLSVVLGKSAPVIFFGITSILAGTLTLLLPETLNRKLPDTVDEAKFDNSDTTT